MLEIRTNCEHCDKHLLNDSSEAMICTFECTFCSDCVTNLLENVCPNCGGGFEKRPTRPALSLVKNPAATEKILKPVDMELFAPLKQKNKIIDPRKR